MSIDLPLSRILDEIQSVVLERHLKYGPTNISNSPGGPLNGLRVRLHDKLARLNNAVDTHGYGDAVDGDATVDFDDDSFRDCFIDLVGYGLIGLLVVDGDWPSGKPEKPLKDLVDRDQVARVLGARKMHRWSELCESGNDPNKLDEWAVGTTFKPDGRTHWYWTREAAGWRATFSLDGYEFPTVFPSLLRVVDYCDYTDGTITEPSTLQKEAA